MKDQKQILRQEARKHREWIDPAENDSALCVPNFFDSIGPKPGQVVAAYWPRGRECDPSPIMERLVAEGITCALPVVEKGSRVLKFACWNEGITMREGIYGIMEPDSQEWVEPDILIVPTLAFDRYGVRLGQGGGYYDATLAALRAKKDVLAVGLAYAQQIVLFKLPSEPHDQKLDWVITPQGTHYFG